MWSWDRRALEGMPLKLLIMSLLISLTFPVVAGSLDSFERSTARSGLIVEGSRLGSAIEEVMSSGEGNRRIIEVSVPMGAVGRSMRLEIGGPLDDPSSLTIRCSSGGLAFHNVILDDPPVRCSGVNGQAVVLEAGQHQLSIECARSGGRPVVRVAVIE
jgi:hypothetical protein